MTTSLRLTLRVAVCLAMGSRLFAQTLAYGTHVNIAPVQIGSDTLSIMARHAVNTGVDQREINFFFRAQGPAQYSTMLVSDAQVISAGIAKSLSIVATNGTPITQSGQTVPVVVESMAVPLQSGFVMLQQPDGTWTFSYTKTGYPTFERRYTSAQLQQFADYLNLGVAFANALP